MGYFDSYRKQKTNGYFSGYYNRSNEDSAMPQEAQIDMLDKQLQERGINAPPMVERSPLERIIDGISITTYPIMGAIDSIVKGEDAGQVLNSAWEGVQAANPFGDGYAPGRKIFSDVLQSAGWKREQESPDAQWYNPATWNANNTAQNVVGFAGDVLLDPLTYLTGGLEPLLKGSGVRLGESVAKAGERVLAKEAYQQASKNAIPAVGDYLKSAGLASEAGDVADIMKHVDNLSGYVKPESPLKWGVGKAKFKLVDDSVLRQIGDNTFAPIVNSIGDALGKSKFGKAWNKKFIPEAQTLLKETARVDPEKAAKKIAFAQWHNKLNADFKVAQTSIVDNARQVFEGISPQSQKEMTKLMQMNGAFDTVMESIATKDFKMLKTKEAKQVFETLEKTKNELEDTLRQFGELEANTAKVKTYQETLRSIETILNSSDALYKDMMNAEVFNDLAKVLNTDDVTTINHFLNNFVNKDVDVIEAELKSKGFETPHDMAIEIRTYIDQASEYVDSLDRPYWTGQGVEKQVTNLDGGLPMTDASKPKMSISEYLNTIHETSKSSTKSAYTNPQHPNIELLKDLAKKITKNVAKKDYNRVFSQNLATLSKLPVEGLERIKAHLNPTMEQLRNKVSGTIKNTNNIKVAGVDEADFMKNREAYDRMLSDKNPLNRLIASGGIYDAVPIAKEQIAESKSVITKLEAKKTSEQLRNIRILASDIASNSGFRTSKTLPNAKRQNHIYYSIYENALKMSDNDLKQVAEQLKREEYTALRDKVKVGEYNDSPFTLKTFDTNEQIKTLGEKKRSDYAQRLEDETRVAPKMQEFAMADDAITNKNVDGLRFSPELKTSDNFNYVEPTWDKKRPVERKSYFKSDSTQLRFDTDPIKNIKKEYTPEQLEALTKEYNIKNKALETKQNTPPVVKTNAKYEPVDLAKMQAVYKEFTDAGISAEDISKIFTTDKGNILVNNTIINDAGMIDYKRFEDFKNYVLREFKSNNSTHTMMDSNGRFNWNKYNASQNAEFSKNFGDEVPVNTYNANGVKMSDEIGSPQNVKANMVANAFERIAEKHPEFADYFRQFNVKLANVDGLNEATIGITRPTFINEEGKYFISKDGTVKEGKFVGERSNTIVLGNNKNKDVAGRIEERVIPHEFAHALGKDMKQFIYEDNKWLAAMQKDKAQVFGRTAPTFAIAQEDFAESFAKYLNEPEAFAKQYPERYAQLEASIGEFKTPYTKTPNNVPEPYVRPQTAKQYVIQTMKEYTERSDKIIDDIVNKGLDDAEATVKLNETNQLLENAGDNETFRQMFKDKTGNEAFEKVHNTIIKSSAKLNVNDESMKAIFGKDAQSASDAMVFIREQFNKFDELENYDTISNTRVPRYVDDNINVPEKYKDIVATLKREPNTIENINKMLKEQTGLDNVLETSLGQIYIKRGLLNNQIVYEKKFYEKLVNDFGTTFNNLAEAQGKTIHASIEDIRKITNNMDDVDKAKELMKNLGLPDNILSTTKQIVKIDGNVFATLKSMDDTFKAFEVPELLTNYINTTGKTLIKQDSNALLNVYDNFLRLWKINSTAVNAGFHARNYTSNQFANYLAVGSKAFDVRLQKYAGRMLGNDELTLSKTFITHNGKQRSLLDVKKEMNELGLLDEGQFQNDFKRIDDESSNAFDAITDKARDRGVDVKSKGKFDWNTLNPLSPVLDIKNPIKSLTQKVPSKREFVGYQAGAKIGQNVENHSKIVNYLANLELGKTKYEAAESVKKFLFDYREVTPFEAKFMKRVIPFYTWMRKNIPLQLDQLMFNTNVYRNTFKGIRSIESGVPVEDRVDDKAKNKFARDWTQLLGHATGDDGKEKPLFLNPNLPYQNVNQLDPGNIVDTLISSSTPFIKAPLELGMNKNIYFDSPISRGISDQDKAPAYLQALLGGTKEAPAMISPETRYMLQNAPSLENLSKIMEAIDSGNDEKMMMNLGKTIGGVSTYPYDVDKYKKWAYRDRITQLKTILKNAKDKDKAKMIEANK